MEEYIRTLEKQRDKLITIKHNTINLYNQELAKCTNLSEVQVIKSKRNLDIAQYETDIDAINYELDRLANILK
jgi:low affinity Fe/Cu permease